jgi:hypothetical protein
MPKYTAPTIGDYPHRLVRIARRKCHRNGQLSRDRLIREYGAETVLPDLRTKIATAAGCERVGKMHDPCDAHFQDLVPEAFKAKP